MALEAKKKKRKREEAAEEPKKAKREVKGSKEEKTASKSAAKKSTKKAKKQETITEVPEDNAANGAGATAAELEESPRKATKKTKKAVSKKRTEATAKSSGAAEASSVGNGVQATVAEGDEDAKEPQAKRMRTRSMDKGEKDENEVKANATPLGDFDICDETKSALVARGITGLFPIQAMTYPDVLAGKDLVGRARTGMGKTLAFALPVIERVLQMRRDGIASRGRGRPPLVLCMAPTRELAKQVAQDFELTARSLTTLCIYGGAPFDPQIRTLHSGVDVVVGTPGRVVDHINRGNLKLDQLRFAILDEADQMLDMGFKEELELIFSAMGSADEGDGRTWPRQTLLFSATLPDWVSEVKKQYLRKDCLSIDLVGDSSIKASTDVSHIAVPCHWQTRPKTIGDIISLHAGQNGRTIVFCERKKDCNELIMDEGITYECQALHGDIAQSQRETTLAGFREGRFRVLVATDVAARGLDMVVDLVIMIEPPVRKSGYPDFETYVHRSGRTGRAGRKGVCVTLYTPKQRQALQMIEKKIGNVFVWQGAPQPGDILASAANQALESLSKVDEAVVPSFMKAAEVAAEQFGDVKRALAATLALASGHTKMPQPRSLLTNTDGYITCQFHAGPGKTVHGLGYVWGAIRRCLPEECCSNVRGISVLADSSGAVFDVPGQYKDILDEILKNPQEHWLSLPEVLPAIRLRESPMGGSRGGRGGRGGRGARGGWGGRSPRGGGFGRGRGRGRFRY